MDLPVPKNHLSEFANAIRNFCKLIAFLIAFPIAGGVSNLELTYFFKCVCETAPALPIIHEHIIDPKDRPKGNPHFGGTGLSPNYQISYRSMEGWFYWDIISKNICSWVSWIRTEFVLYFKQIPEFWNIYVQFTLEHPQLMLVLCVFLLLWMFHPTLKFMMGCFC